MLYFLTGTTASGKSALAHKIAIEKKLPILSLDSMAVYKGLDILTAKPTEVMRSQVLYYGLDIAETTSSVDAIEGIPNALEKALNNGLVIVCLIIKRVKSAITLLTKSLNASFPV